MREGNEETITSYIMHLHTVLQQICIIIVLFKLIKICSVLEIWKT